jgi:hypothetical protein
LAIVSPSELLSDIVAQRIPLLGLSASAGRKLYPYWKLEECFVWCLLLGRSLDDAMSEASGCHLGIKVEGKAAFSDAVSRLEASYQEDVDWDLVREVIQKVVPDDATTEVIDALVRSLEGSPSPSDTKPRVPERKLPNMVGLPLTVARKSSAT